MFLFIKVKCHWVEYRDLLYLLQVRSWYLKHQRGSRNSEHSTLVVKYIHISASTRSRTSGIYCHKVYLGESAQPWVTLYKIQIYLWRISFRWTNFELIVEWAPWDINTSFTWFLIISFLYNFEKCWKKLLLLFSQDMLVD